MKEKVKKRGKNGLFPIKIAAYSFVNYVMDQKSLNDFHFISRGNKRSGVS